MFEILLLSLALWQQVGDFDPSQYVAHFHKAAPVISREQVVEETTDFIASFEGFRSCPYADAGGWSVGYGSLARDSSCISETAARRIVEKEVERLLDQVSDHYETEFTINESVAIVSFAYNTPQSRPVLTNENCVNGFTDRDRATIEKCFSPYSWLRGLKIRRDKELEIFFSPYYGRIH